MKKFLAVALIAASFTACNDGDKTTETTTGSDTSMMVTPNPADTVMVVTDTTVKTTTTTMGAKDTTKK